MAARDNLSNYQFRYRPTGPQQEYPGYGSDFDPDSGFSLYDHEVTAVHKPSKKVVGRMLYHADGPLFQIDVNEDHQRRGVATGMVEHGIKVADAVSSTRSSRHIPRPDRAYDETYEGQQFGDAMEKRGLFNPS